MLSDVVKGKRTDGGGRDSNRPSALAPLRLYAFQKGLRVEDNVVRGGAFWVLHPSEEDEIGRELKRLGMHFKASRGWWV